MEKKERNEIKFPGHVNMILTVHTLGTWFLALQAIVTLRTGCRTVIAGPAGCTDAAASVRIARGVVQASANLITIFTIVTARTVRLAINALGSVRFGSVYGYGYKGNRETNECKTRNTN